MTSRTFQTATHTPSAHTGGHTTRTGGATGGAAAATATHTAGFTSAADDDLFGFLDADTAAEMRTNDGDDDGKGKVRATRQAPITVSWS